MQAGPGAQDISPGPAICGCHRADGRNHRVSHHVARCAGWHPRLCHWRFGPKTHAHDPLHVTHDNHRDWCSLQLLSVPFHKENQATCKQIGPHPWLAVAADIHLQLFRAELRSTAASVCCQVSCAGLPRLVSGFSSNPSIPLCTSAGIGGVHRGGESTLDVSADLTELGRTPVAVVCAGAKSILDIPRTLEYLETQVLSKEWPSLLVASLPASLLCQHRLEHREASALASSFCLSSLMSHTFKLKASALQLNQPLPMIPHGPFTGSLRGVLWHR